jgi:hypothetical protein
MKNILVGLSLIACCACSSPSQKNAVSDGSGANSAKPECTGACEAGKSPCCSEKAGAEAKECPAMKKVQG